MNILLIDDDPQCLESLEVALRLSGYNVVSFASPLPAIAAYDPRTVDVVITDYHLPGMKGYRVLKELQAKGVAPPVIVITGDFEKRLEKDSLKAGAVAFFRKPLDLDEIIATLEMLKKTSDHQNHVI